MTKQQAVSEMKYQLSKGEFLITLMSSLAEEEFQLLQIGIHGKSKP